MNNLVKFGVKIVQKGYQMDQIASLCLAAEQMGFDSFWVADHMYSWGRKPTNEPALECWTLLSALSTMTKTVRLGSLVVCQLLRHPALLAKMTSTLDVLSGGRLNFGIGACGPSTPTELRGFGLPFPKRAERLERLGETLEILKSMWTKERTNYSGKHFILTDVLNSPKPVQKPHPPILIGGEREDILKLAAKYADLWNCRRLGLEEFGIKANHLNSYCSSNGRTSSTLVKSWQGSIMIARSDLELQEKMKRYPPEEGMMIGTPEDITEKIRGYVDAEAGYFMFHFQDDSNNQSLELFADHVMTNF